MGTSELPYMKTRNTGSYYHFGPHTHTDMLVGGQTALAFMFVV